MHIAIDAKVFCEVFLRNTNESIKAWGSCFVNTLIYCFYNVSNLY